MPPLNTKHKETRNAYLTFFLNPFFSTSLLRKRRKRIQIFAFSIISVCPVLGRDTNRPFRAKGGSNVVVRVRVHVKELEAVGDIGGELARHGLLGRLDLRDELGFVGLSTLIDVPLYLGALVLSVADVSLVSQGLNTS